MTHLFSESRRGHTGFFLEKAGKIGLILNPYLGSYINDGQTGFAEKALGALDADYVNPIPDAAACRFLHQSAQVIPADTDLGSVIRNARWRLTRVESKFKELVDSIRENAFTYRLYAGQKQIQALFYKDPVSFLESICQHIEEFAHKCSFVEPETLVDWGR